MLTIVVAKPSALQSPCLSCKMLYGSTCCEIKNNSPQFPMTYGEASRIAKYTNKSILDAVVMAKVPEDVEKWWKGFSPEHADLIVEGTALYLPVIDNACVYLGPNGCTIPNTKPSSCSLFPFSRSSAGGWSVGELVQAPGICFAQDSNNGDFYPTLQSFGETVSHLNAVVRRRDRDARVHVAQMKKLKRKWKSR